MPAKQFKPGEVLTTREDVQRYIDYRLEEERKRQARLYGPFVTIRWFLGGIRDGVQTLIGAPMLIHQTLKARRAARKS